MATRRRVLTAIAGAALPWAMGGSLRAQQNYPNRPIKLIVPFPPGGPIDTMARLVGEQLSASVGQVVVENRPGGGSTIGTKFVAAADPDGYTLLFGSSGSLAVAPALYSSLDIDPRKAFVPIATVALLPHVFVENLDVPAHTVADAHRRRIRRLRQSQSWQAQLWRRTRHPAAFAQRFVQDRGEHRRRVHSLQWVGAVDH
jgi:tripartite-type tricarboxylate transporter receptor subunit TctC